MIFLYGVLDVAVVGGLGDASAKMAIGANLQSIKGAKSHIFFKIRATLVF